jgi:hypothetical protein
MVQLPIPSEPAPQISAHTLPLPVNRFGQRRRAAIDDAPDRPAAIANSDHSQRLASSVSSSDTSRSAARWRVHLPV